MALVDTHLLFCVTGKTIARSLIGASLGRGDPLSVADYIVSDRFEIPAGGVEGDFKNRRFYNGVIKVFTALHFLDKRYRNPLFAKMKIAIVSSMLAEGRSESSVAKIVADSLTCIIHGKANNEFEEIILSSLSKSERANLWRFRRNMQKDDNNPFENSMKAIQRMCTVREPANEDLLVMEKTLSLWEERAGQYVQANLDSLRDRHDRANLHRSSATIFYARNAGGGSGEMHLTVALYRLSCGKSSTLCDVFGSVPEQATIDELVGRLESFQPAKQEVITSCSWMIDQLDTHGISFPFLCIYPDREPKSRTFMMLPYCLQLGAYFAAHVVSAYLRSREDSKEVFTGFDTGGLLRKIQKDIEAGASMFLSLDSAVATDQIPHSVCRRIYGPFYPAFSAYTKKTVEKVFSPTRVHVAKGRPRNFVNVLGFESTLGEKTGLRIRRIELPKDSPKGGRKGTPLFRVWPDGVPKFIRTYALRAEIVKALTDTGRILLMSPTGSGKTILAASLLNAIIQFPSVAALEIFAGSLTDLDIIHNCYYARKKELNNWDVGFNEPRTILCTSFFVEQLHRQYPRMVVVLDEADSRQETYVWNTYWTRRDRAVTLLMTATPEEIQGEEFTRAITLPGGTNFPVSDMRCTYSDMIELLSSEGFGKSLVCTYSEPQCEKISRLLELRGIKTLSLTARRRLTEYQEALREATVIISTNVIRSSVTIPDVVHAFDLGLYYEQVDFPVEGFESLMLFEASPGMRKQLRGRVGRMAAGTYWDVHMPRVQPQKYTQRLLCRLPALSARLGKVPMEKLSRPLNLGSMVVERFSQALHASFGIHREHHRPLWATAIRKMATSARKSLLAAVAFDSLGIGSRLTQLKEDEDLAEPYEEYLAMSHTDYWIFSKALMNKLYKKGWFSNEFSQIARWTDDLEEAPGEQLDTQENLKAVCLSLWRSLCVASNTTLTGTLRNFQTSPPPHYELVEGGHYVAFGLCIHQSAVTCRGLLRVPDVLALEIIQAAQRVISVSCEFDSESIPILTHETLALHHGRQRKSVHLAYDKYSNVHVYAPSDLPRIWEALKETVEEQRGSADFTTNGGSPMSSAGSFPVLCGCGVAAHDYARHVTGEKLHSAAIWGDDDVVVGSEAAAAADQQSRESLGLATKESATGRLSLRDSEGVLIDPIGDQHPVQRGLALFTERLIDPWGRLEIPSIKPAGAVRLFQAYHPEELMLKEESFVSDMADYDRNVARKDFDFHKVLTENPEAVDKTVARRSTAPRRILAGALKRDLHPYQKLATGSDVNALFDTLESFLLLFYPSSKGNPDRVMDPAEQILGHPIVSYEMAQNLSEFVQSEDCYFKNGRPPLRFTKGMYAVEVATLELEQRIGHIPPMPKVEMALDMVGWGNSAGKQVDDAVEDLTFTEESPIDFGDINW
jgi:hypothetical protein